MQYCSLQHRILLSSPDTNGTEHRIRFGPATSFILGNSIGNSIGNSLSLKQCKIIFELSLHDSRICLPE